MRVAIAAHAPNDSAMESPTLRASTVVALSLVVGVFFTSQTVFMALASGRPLRVEWDLWQELLYWMLWALLAPRIVGLAGRWPLDAKPVRRGILIHLAISIVLASVQTVVAFGLHLAALAVTGLVPIASAPAWMLQQRPSLVWGVFMGIPFYWAVIGIYNVFRFRGRSELLESELTRSQLDALRSQLRPHFLFNTLNAISVLTAEDPEKARRMVLRLGSLLRRSLDEEEHEIPLREELSFLDDYLDIQRVRFGDKLVITLAIDPAAAEARVPVLMLQPLVENAIEHGAPEKDAVTTSITVRAGRTDGTLRLSVEDNGPGVVPPTREGIGLRNTRERLWRLYGDRATIDLGAIGNGGGVTGTRVDISIPLSGTRI
jgi:two-component system LytT family sensor kinase